MDREKRICVGEGDLMDASLVKKNDGEIVNQGNTSPDYNCSSKSVAHTHDIAQITSSTSPAATTQNHTAKKPKLRKGKWTIEEEEYTSRIIQYFSTGLLTLPDGATLRSYLAEKLNCDPMRITKKFTGACCLGRRAYHLRDRPRVSSAEIDIANFELLHLEQRFRLRVEHERTGLPLPPRHELLPSQPAPPPASIVSADILPSLFSLHQQAAAASSSTSSSTTPPTQTSSPAPAYVPTNKSSLIQQNQLTIHPNIASMFPGLATYPGLNLNSTNAHAATQPTATLGDGQQLLLQQRERNHSRDLGAIPSAASSPSSQLQVLNNVIASLVFSRALASQPTRSSQILHNTSIAATNSNNLTNCSVGVAPVAASTKSPPDLLCGSHTNPVNDTRVSTIINEPPIPTPIQSKSASYDQQADQIKLYQQQLENTNHRCPNSNSSFRTKEDRARQLKAAFEEQQKALRLAYEKSLRDAEDEERKEKTANDASAAMISSASKSDENDTSKKVSKHRPGNGASISISPAEQLQKSYEAHLASLQQEERNSSSSRSSLLVPASSSNSTNTSVALQPQKASINPKEVQNMKLKGEKVDLHTLEKAPDEQDGTLLLGFLNSLRESFEDAVDSKSKRDKINYCNDMNQYFDGQVSAKSGSKTILTNLSTCTQYDTAGSSLWKDNTAAAALHSSSLNSSPMTTMTHFQNSKHKIKPATITETSSNSSSRPIIDQSSFSQDDLKSEKMGSSSSEESYDKEASPTILPNRAINGPPRKRLKGFLEQHEFTRENLIAHSRRMDMECGNSGGSSSCDE